MHFEKDFNNFPNTFSGLIHEFSCVSYAVIHCVNHPLRCRSEGVRHQDQLLDFLSATFFVKTVLRKPYRRQGLDLCY